MPWQQNDEDGTSVGRGEKQRPKFLWGLVIGVSGVSGVGFHSFQLFPQVVQALFSSVDADKRCKLIAAVTILDPIAVHLVATPRHPNFSGWKGFSI